MTDDAITDERDALAALLGSDGWKAFTKACDEQYGDTAVVGQINRTLGSVPRGHQDAVDDTVQQILAAQTAIRQMLSWPATRLAQLKAGQAKERFPWRRRA